MKSFNQAKTAMQTTSYIDGNPGGDIGRITITQCHRNKIGETFFPSWILQESTPKTC